MSENTFFSRRLFISRGVGLLSIAGTLPLFLDRAAHAMAADFEKAPQGAGRPERVLVILQLAGGNDGLNTIIPTSNDEYYKARPKLGVAKKTALRLTDDFGIHPAAEGLKKLYDAGNLAIVHAVGYPNPNRSHFRSTDIWQTAEPDKIATTGWLGRYFDSCCNGADPGPKDAKAAAKPAPPDAAISLTNEPPQALQGEKYLPLSFRSPNDLTYRDGARNAGVRGAFEKLNDIDMVEERKAMDEDHTMPAPAKRIVIPLGTRGSVEQPREEADDFLQRTALNARVSAEQIKASAARIQNKATYPQSRLATDLKLVAQMIASGLPTRVYYVSMGGFDTHSQQDNRHQRLLEEFSGAMAAFVDDLKQLGQLDRTTVMTFSEFGRRVNENGSGGTDHGEAAPLFVAGANIKPGLHGTFPDLSPSKLHRGDVPYTTDFRRLYATMLKDWLKADDVKALGKKFEPMPILKNA